MKKKGADIEMYREMMEYFQAENASKSAQLAAMSEENKALREEIASLRQSHREDLERLRASYEDKMLRMQDSFERRLDRMAEVNAGMSQQLSDALASGKLARGRHYGNSTEQSDLLNNRKKTSRKSEEDDFDGTPPSSPSGKDGDVRASEDAGADANAKAEKKKSRRPKESEGRMHFDQVVHHPVDEEGLMEIPAGGRLLPGTSWYEVVTVIPAKTICHRYEYQRYVLARELDKDIFGYTLAADIRNQCPTESCPFTAELLSFIFTQKYAYHQPQKRIRMMLKDMGVRIPKQTFNRYFLDGAETLLGMLGETYRSEMRQGLYYMIDETVMTVGVDDKELGRRYLSRYMWGFYNRRHNLVEFVYENGSRAQTVLKEYFKDIASLDEMVISCDGYNAYKLFDSDLYPGAMVVGCWTHARRQFIEALEVCRPQCREMISMIGALFENETICRQTGMTDEERLDYRLRKSRPVLNSIRAMADRLWNDTGLMAIGLLKKAVGYLRNQWGHLSNILKTGIAEISNNYSEQRIRPLKLSLKNCLNIGSERAARLHAFMFSLAESCRLNSVNIQEYFTCLFSKARSQLSQDDLKGLLPNYYLAKC